MIPSVPLVDFSFGNVGDQAPNSGPSFPQAWDASQDMFQQEWPQYPSQSHTRGRSQTHPQPQYQQQCNEHYQSAPHSTSNALPEALRHHSLPVLQSSHSYVPPPQPPRQDEPILSPLHIDQLPHTFPYQDLIIPPTPELPKSALPSPATTVFYTPCSTVGELDPFSPPNHFPSLHISSPTSTHSYSHSPYGTPYHPLPSPMASSTTISTTYSSPFPYTPNLPNNVFSPIVGSPSSYHSMSVSNTPATAPAPNLPPASMPAFVSAVDPPASQEKAPAPLPPTRQELPQKLGLVSTRSVFRAESFSVGSKPGVRVRDVLHNKVQVDGHEDRVFETTGVRQFRFTIDWPGYESFGTYIRVQNKGGGYITRGELAKAVCQRIETFMRKAKRKRPSSPEDEAYTIAHGKSRHGITIDKLWLVRVVPKAASMWMAELEMQT
ncbi:hypothetical protein GSI_04535 [Ganoderma sinense ZZ0214-1]|uniref:Uncharacterized protein n=1 Tax=Ganoderma sinense ZZ0214-1 TaxID=1077348 RepID=A0A2G8SH46_9APHY|nr:hypothetical protein GSI_04535 [Ganoderma sinense ZZ0214-1]